MNKEFVPCELALDLKELGFDEPCLAFKDFDYSLEIGDITKNSSWSSEIISIPLYQQAFRFFREKYGLRGFIGFRPNVKQFDFHIYDMSLSGKEYVKQRTMTEYNKDPLAGTHEEAELACLIKLIEIVKESDNENSI